MNLILTFDPKKQKSEEVNNTFEQYCSLFYNERDFYVITDNPDGLNPKIQILAPDKRTLSHFSKQIFLINHVPFQFANQDVLWIDHEVVKLEGNFEYLIENCDKDKYNIMYDYHVIYFNLDNMRPIQEKFINHEVGMTEAINDHPEWYKIHGS